MKPHHAIRHIAEFERAMSQAGIATEDPIQADGRLHRYRIAGDKLGTANGWYVFYADGHPSGVFGSWKHGVKANWRADGFENLSVEEQRATEKRIKQARKEAADKREQRNQVAERQAADIWNSARQAQPKHPYLVRKRILPFGARQLFGELLLLPVTDFSGNIHSLQYINAAGDKRLHSGGRKAGNFIPINGDMATRSRLLICEGFATGATLAELEPDSCVIAAIDAGNLLAVAVEARRRLPDASIIICGDADPIGRKKANAAAVAARALVAFPEFPDGVEGTDFNDLVVHQQGVA